MCNDPKVIDVRVGSEPLYSRLGVQGRDQNSGMFVQFAIASDTYTVRVSSIWGHVTFFKRKLIRRRSPLMWTDQIKAAVKIAHDQ